MIEKELRDYLAETLTDVGVWLAAAPQNATSPCITLSLQSRERNASQSSLGNYYFSTILLSCHVLSTETEGYIAAEVLANRVIAALPSFKGTQGGHRVDSIVLSNEAADSPVWLDGGSLLVQSRNLTIELAHT
jgi:hypothetical protein